MPTELFVLAKGRSGQLSTILWRARLTVGFWAVRHVGVLFCPAPPRPAALPCAAPTRTAHGIFGFLIRQVSIVLFQGKLLRKVDYCQSVSNRFLPRITAVRHLGCFYLSAASDTCHVVFWFRSKSIFSEPHLETKLHRSFDGAWVILLLYQTH